MTDLRKAVEIKTWSQRCDEHPDHAGIVSTQMIMDRMQEEIDELRQALAESEQYDQTALELCEKCGWKAIIPDEGCLVCARNEQEPVMWSIFDGKYHDVFDTKYDVDKIIKFKKGKVVVKPLYTAPAKKEWVGLTDEELSLLWLEYHGDNFIADGRIINYEKAIEAKLKEKNGKQFSEKLKCHMDILEKLLKEEK